GARASGGRDPRGTEPGAWSPPSGRPPTARRARHPRRPASRRPVGVSGQKDKELELVQAAVQAAHTHGKFVIAHPSISAGARVAIEGGVDILAHTFPSELDRRPWDRALPPMMRERGMALVPTLKLLAIRAREGRRAGCVTARVLGNAQAQLRAFADLGGQVLFGTDVGYMTDYDPTDEYVYMKAAGLSYPSILAALTTAPAERFGAAAKAGRLARGMAADIVVLEGDPAQDIRALGRVRYTVRGGRIIYRKAS